MGGPRGMTSSSPTPRGSPQRHTHLGRPARGSAATDRPSASATSCAAECIFKRSVPSGAAG
eukprot:scaffold19352_cov66-Phaeocystis_antarctica.AAC.2